MPVLPGQRPHISAAVKQLRIWVTLCSLIFAACTATQMFVFGFVQYTDVRFAKVEETRVSRQVQVIGGAAHTDAVVDPTKAAQNTLIGHPSASSKDMGRASSTTVSVRLPSEADRWLDRASSIACGVGIISVVCLAIFTLLGTVIAGGGNVPGVERTVTASVWSVVLAILCLPWNTILPTLGIPGVFVGYQAMTTAADLSVINGQQFGSVAALAQWVIAPMISLFTVLGVSLWFRAGVEKGVIITSPSELDQAVAREAEMIARRGISNTAPKAVGALQRAIGEEVPVAATVERAIDEAARSAVELASSTMTASGPQRKAQARSVVDADFKRPI